MGDGVTVRRRRPEPEPAELTGDQAGQLAAAGDDELDRVADELLAAGGPEGADDDEWIVRVGGLLMETRHWAQQGDMASAHEAAGRIHGRGPVE